MFEPDNLSDRKRRILDGIAAGKSNGVLAEELGISVDGVKWHVSEMLWETGCADRRELTAWWRARHRAPAFALRWPSRESFGGPMRFAGTLALTAVFVVAIYAGWTCSGASAPATGTPASALGKIAYVQDGDLYVKQLPDGTPRRITTHTYGNTAYMSPQWSPSGEWLLAYTNAQAAIMRADGSDERKLEGRFNAPVWSPDFDRLAWVAVGEGGQPNQLLVENADGAGRKTVARAEPGPDEAATLSDPTWSDDGTYIAYVETHLAPLPSSILPGAYIAPKPTYEAIRVTSFGGMPPEEMYVEDAPPRDGIGLVHWSRQGIFFDREPGFSADIADGVELKLLNPSTNAVTEGAPPVTTLHFAPTQPVTISPANPTILLDPTLRSTDNAVHYAITDGSGRATWTHKRIAGLSWASGTVFDLTPPSVAAIQPAVSPDGEQIAYSAMPDTPSPDAGQQTKQALMERKLWTLDMLPLTCTTPGACSQPMHQLTSDPAYRDEYPRWSAGGTQILWVRMDAQDHGSLWLMRADGSNPHEVLDQFDIPDNGDPANPWFGYYGTISWQQSFAWWQPR